MEMFNFFLDGLKRKNPELAAEVLPEMEEYIAARRSFDTNDFFPDSFSENGTMNYPESDIQEQYEDAKDIEALEKETQISADYETALKNWEEYTSAQNINGEQEVLWHHDDVPEATLNETGDHTLRKINNVPLELVL